ncbi:MAG: hypothetical protein LBU34_07030 [Planctomycetaceae bacterium]|jgi:hypothetical protein|nr:hypothetical protein [Planctomycetaceae bacterium]
MTGIDDTENKYGKYPSDNNSSKFCWNEIEVGETNVGCGGADFKEQGQTGELCGTPDGAVSDNICEQQL